MNARRYIFKISLKLIHNFFTYLEKQFDNMKFKTNIEITKVNELYHFNSLLIIGNKKVLLNLNVLNRFLINIFKFYKLTQFLI